MTINLHRSLAGDGTLPLAESPVRPAAVWEPAVGRGPGAEVPGVRTLLPSGRTQGRDGDGSGRVEAEPVLPSTGWRENAVTYLLGALFGLAVVSATFLGPGEGADPGPTGYPVGTQPQVQSALR